MLESLKELSDRICAEMGLDKHDDPQILAAILATALAEARAEGRRQGLEAAAKDLLDVAERIEAIHHQTYRHLNGKPLETALIDIGNMARELRNDLENRAFFAKREAAGV